MKTQLRPRRMAARHGRSRILIVGQDDSDLLACRRNLRKNFRVSAVRDGLECIAELRERIPQVVVIDHKILWGGAAGVLAVMREDHEFSMVPVILLTDFQNPKHLEESARSDQHLVQSLPCSVEQLTLRIRAAMEL